MESRRHVLRSDLHGRVLAAGGRATDQQRHRESLTLHLARHVDHLVERRGDETGEADRIDTFAPRGLEDLIARYHDAEVDHLVVVAAEHHTDDVLADVVHVTLDGRHQDLALRPGSRRLLALHVGQQARNGFLHHARALDDLWEEHLPRAEEIADDLHAVHQRPFDDVERLRVFVPCLLHVFLDVLDESLDERMRQPLFHGRSSPSEVGFALRRFSLHALGELDQPLGGVRTAVEDHVLDELEQVLRDLFVDGELTGVDDRHVEARADRVVEERRVDRFAHHVVTAKREGEIGDAATHLGSGARPLDDARRLEERVGVFVVLLDPGGDREDVGIEDDVLRRKADLLGEDAIRALTDLHLARSRIGLSLLVERHDDDRRSIAAHESRVRTKRLFPFLQADRVDDPLPLYALEARFDHRPLRAIDDDRHARDLRLGADEVEKRRHRLLGVEHALVHVDVDHVGAAANLVERHRQRALVVAGTNQAREALRARHVGALADRQKARFGAHGQRLEAGEPHQPVGAGHAARRQPTDRVGDRANVRGCRATAAADHVDPSLLGELAQQPGGLLGSLVVAAERVRAARHWGRSSRSTSRSPRVLRGTGASRERRASS